MAGSYCPHLNAVDLHSAACLECLYDSSRAYVDECQRAKDAWNRSLRGRLYRFKSRLYHSKFMDGVLKAVKLVDYWLNPGEPL